MRSYVCACAYITSNKVTDPVPVKGDTQLVLAGPNLRVPPSTLL